MTPSPNLLRIGVRESSSRSPILASRSPVWGARAGRLRERLASRGRGFPHRACLGGSLPDSYRAACAPARIPTDLASVACCLSAMAAQFRAKRLPAPTQQATETSSVGIDRASALQIAVRQQATDARSVGMRGSPRILDTTSQTGPPRRCFDRLSHTAHVAIRLTIRLQSASSR
jgi:hypothetical protein